MATRNPWTTKRHNYLLRSTHSESLIRIMILASAGRIVAQTASVAIVKRDNTWAGYCGWEVKALESRGMLALDRSYEHGRMRYRLTEAGREAITGALTTYNRDGMLVTLAESIVAWVESINTDGRPFPAALAIR